MNQMYPSSNDHEQIGKTEVEYMCPSEHRFTRVFAAGVESPEEWDCPHCGKVATRQGESAGPTTGAVEEPGEPASDDKRTPWDMLLERRSISELDAMLKQRIADMEQPGDEAD